jgi:hypothetical protein
VAKESIASQYCICLSASHIFKTLQLGAQHSRHVHAHYLSICTLHIKMTITPPRPQLLHCHPLQLSQSSWIPDQQQALITELEDYFSGRFPCSDGNVLTWWKVMVLLSHNFKTLTSSNAETCHRFPNFVSYRWRYFSHSWR